MKILQSLLFLAKQNITIHGHEKFTSNLYQLTLLRGLDDPELEAWAGQKRGSYLHHETQNEILHIMGTQIL